MNSKTLYQINLKGNLGVCDISIGAKFTSFTDKITDKTRCVIITDSIIDTIYNKEIAGFKKIIIKPGEKFKNLETAYYIYEKMLELGIDRHSMIIGLGGGIVCDITGFVSSTYLRGIHFGFVPTTLLAQTDAAIGGKNGVNFKGYKNLIGVFKQPEFIICDPYFLKTLPHEELINGFAEVIKHASIADEEYFKFLEKNSNDALNINNKVIAEIIYRSVNIKLNIVKSDETEKNKRKLLNFGHTFAHAIEKTTGISHGKAVSIGMNIAAGISVSKKMLSKKSAERLSKLLSKYNLPISANLDKIAVLDAISKDKKRRNEEIDFVFLNNIGSAVIKPIEIKEIENLFNIAESSRPDLSGRYLAPRQGGAATYEKRLQNGL